ncbi:MAG TPA: T9SS C-terminal target domain-containing protein [Blastocatellia bacterium]|nr:T9SS C-terminal target domain-containing protein [Blastocatellia bacterium]
MKKRSRFVNSIIVGSIVLLGALLARVPQGLEAATAPSRQLGTSGAPVPPTGLTVDINNSGRPILEGNEPTYTPWSASQNWFSGGDTTSANFSGVTVRFTRRGSVGTGLQSGYWKLGVENNAYNVKLASDGIKVNNGDSGAQIEMRISGLSAGGHSVQVYHNDWDNHAPGAVAPLTVSVNGSTVISSLPMSVRATNATQAASSYVTFTAVPGEDVVILFQSRNTATYNNVYINGFEIDTANAKMRATNPVPSNADEHANADTGSLTLSWGAAPAGVASHDLYFGTSRDAVAAAMRYSPEFKGNLTSASYQVGGLNSMLTYYWRVDEISPSGEIAKGLVWYLRPRHLAFPGAEGAGSFARGGRGGVVVRVTNLNDSGPGSLRDAIAGNYGPRTVVFEVSGLITLLTDIIIDGNAPPITVAGQTAPGKGICVKRKQLAMSGARDAIMRFMRVRVGKESGETQNGSGMAGVNHSIMDHCSISWGIDEELSSRGARNMTFQRSLISEALNVSGHDKYPPGTAHGYAASIGGDIGSFHHNLLAHCSGRNWSLAGGLDGGGSASGRLEIFNNVVYNWDHRTTDGGAREVNFVNNYYKPGAASTLFVALNAQYEGAPGTQQYYFAGNVMPGYFDLSNQTDGRMASGSVPTTYSPWVGAPFFPLPATIDTAINAYKKVLSDVGCNQPIIDDHDVRVISETLSGTYTYTGSVSGLPGLPDATDDVGGWEDYGNAVRPANWDTDNDGLPNWWEVIKGFNPNSPAGDFSDGNGDPDGDGYTNLEDYLNWMAEPHVDCKAGSSVDIDLAALSRGYSNSGPSYSISGRVNGTVTLVHGRYARFTPSASAKALGSFSYTVTDGEGDTMTRTIGIRIIGPGEAITHQFPMGFGLRK